MRNRLIAFALLFTGISVAQYQSALPGYEYKFPHDYFNHPDYQMEWWYYTGNLRATDGHRFGFELTFFRQAVARDQKNDSPWSVHDLYFAHLALSDLDGQKFYHQERINRAGPGIAGVSQADGMVWNGNWQSRWQNGAQHLQAIGEDFTLDLNLVSSKPPVIHGENGVSQKSEGRGHASHYFSLTRLLTKGEIDLHGEKFTGDGTSWMDHEFFTESLGNDEVGWDWISLQFNDNTELMLYRLRRKDGSADPYSSGTYVDAQGHSTHLALQDFTMRPTGSTWHSSESGATYPISWHVTVPSLGIDVQLATPLASQELATGNKRSPSYWEGAITIAGKRGTALLNGVGYLEMTGYAGRLIMDH